MGSLIEDFAKAPAAPFLAKHPVKTGNEKFVVESIYNGLLEHFLWFKIERQEGSSVIGDKMSFIQRRLIRAIKEGKNLNLQPTYADYPKRKMHEDEKPDMVVWWASKLFKDTDDLVEQFRNWYFIRDNKKE